MTTLGSPTDKTLCHLDKLSNATSVTKELESKFPDGAFPLESHVAGHSFDEKKKTIGVLRGPEGRVLKAVEKPLLGEREIAFYENLQESQDPCMLELKNYVPKYYGTTNLTVFNKRVKFLMLKDITEGMTEPCVMDIKIGKRTWDPLATPEKRQQEERKYIESRRAYGFCITGFQVYSLSSKKLKKFGKDYGKKLDAKGVKDALKIFLNVTPESPLNRELIMKLLSQLWKIQQFFRTQKMFRFYSSSLLVAYDARRLRHCLRFNLENPKARSFSSLNTFVTPSKSPKVATSVFASLSVPIKAKRNPAIERTCGLKRSISLTSAYETAEKERVLNRSGSGGLDFQTEKLCRTHSYANNFDDDIARMKEDYDALLNELSSSSEERQNWVRVNMIDFTHVFPAEDRGSLDLNYLEGVENLVKLVEMFLTTKDA